MGQILYAIFIGGWMVLLGVLMNGALKKEEEGYKRASHSEEGGQ